MDEERLFWIRELMRGLAENLHECKVCKNRFYEDLVCEECVDNNLWEIEDKDLEEYVTEVVRIVTEERLVK